MPTRRPLVVVNGFVGELPAGDVLPPELTGDSVPVESAIVDLIKPCRSFEKTIARPGTLVTQNIRAWLGSTADNELWQLERVTVNAECLDGAILLIIDCLYFESGNIKINYQVF